MGALTTIMLLMCFPIKLFDDLHGGDFCVLERGVPPLPRIPGGYQSVDLVEVPILYLPVISVVDELSDRVVDGAALFNEVKEGVDTAVERRGCFRRCARRGIAKGLQRSINVPQVQFYNRSHIEGHCDSAGSRFGRCMYG